MFSLYWEHTIRRKTSHCSDIGLDSITLCLFVTLYRKHFFSLHLCNILIYVSCWGRTWNKWPIKIPCRRWHTHSMFKCGSYTRINQFVQLIFFPTFFIWYQTLAVRCCRVYFINYKYYIYHIDGTVYSIMIFERKKNVFIKIISKN